MKIIPRPKTLTVRDGTSEGCIKYVLNESLRREGYVIDARPDGITIEYSTDRGKAYAERTLRQIAEQSKGSIPCLHIEDEPKYPYRGFMVDSARHFLTVEEIKKQIDVAGELKLNIFHWHLTDDQGWRIEIKKYPLLTEVGSYRPQTRGDGTPISGFYTQEEIIDVVNYCRDRHIDVIPEIDMPGHFTAAVAAYPHLSCTGTPTKVWEHYGINYEIACAGKESTFDFVKDVLDEVTALFPYEYIHIGGDEALKVNYTECPDCQRTIEENNLADEEALQGYFMNKVIAYLNGLGRKAMVWNDGTLGNNLKGDFVVHFWKESKVATDSAVRLADEGKGIVFSPFSAFYLDYPCGMTPLKKTYSYEIDDRLRDKIVGVESPLWAEHIPDVLTWEKRAYPRLFALAERGWTEELDYDYFLSATKVLGYYLKEKYGITIDADPNPPFLRGKWDMVKFFLHAYDPNMIKYGFLTAKVKRKMKKRQKGRKNNL